MVTAARSCILAHSATAVAPTLVPSFVQLSWPWTLPGIMFSRVWKADGGPGSESGAASGDASGVACAALPWLRPWDEVDAAVLAGNGLRWATAATPRYTATS